MSSHAQPHSHPNYRGNPQLSVLGIFFLCIFIHLRCDFYFSSRSRMKSYCVHCFATCFFHLSGLSAFLMKMIMWWWCPHLPNAHQGDGCREGCNRLSSGLRAGDRLSPIRARTDRITIATSNNRSEWTLWKFSLACFLKIKMYRDFSGGPGVTTLSFHYRGPGFSLRSGN